MKMTLKEFMKVATKFFEENGTEMNKLNGERLPKHQWDKGDPRKNSRWSIDVYCLLKGGIDVCYYRRESDWEEGMPERFKIPFTVRQPLFDTYILDNPHVSLKFITSQQLKQLIALLK